MDYLTALFCQIDDFCQEFEPQFNRSLIESRKTRNRKSCISTAEIITVWIYFHYVRMRDFKTYYEFDGLLPVSVQTDDVREKVFVTQ